MPKLHTSLHLKYDHHRFPLVRPFGYLANFPAVLIFLLDVNRFFGIVYLTLLHRFNT
jgi:hypothetical protein